MTSFCLYLISHPIAYYWPSIIRLACVHTDCAAVLYIFIYENHITDLFGIFTGPFENGFIFVGPFFCDDKNDFLFGVCCCVCSSVIPLFCWSATTPLCRWFRTFFYVRRKCPQKKKTSIRSRSSQLPTIFVSYWTIPILRWWQHQAVIWPNWIQNKERRKKLKCRLWRDDHCNKKQKK